MEQITTEQQCAIIDEFGELDRQLVPYRSKVKRWSALRDRIVGWFDNYPADQVAQIEGRVYYIELGMRQMRRTIVDMPLLYQSLGHDRFIADCDFSMKNLDKASLANTGEIVSEDRTGPRTIIPVLRKAAHSAPRKRRTSGTESAETRGEARV